MYISFKQKKSGPSKLIPFFVLSVEAYLLFVEENKISVLI